MSDPIPAPTLSVRSIKKILQKELNEFRDSAVDVLYKNGAPDAMRELVENGYRVAQAKLEACQTYEDLEDYLSFAGYRMDLTDWANSL